MVVTLFFFSYGQSLLTPHHRRPPSQGVDFESFCGRSRVVFELQSTQNRLGINRRTTRDRLPGREVSGGGGVSWGGWAVDETISLLYGPMHVRGGETRPVRTAGPFQGKTPCFLTSGAAVPAASCFGEEPQIVPLKQHMLHGPAWT